MNKTWLVIRHEYLLRVLSRGFLVAVIGFPLLMVCIFAGVIWLTVSKRHTPVGVVDVAQVLMPFESYAQLPIGQDSVLFQPFSDQATAQAALDSKAVQAFVVIPADYQASGKVTLYHRGNAYEGIEGDLEKYLRASLLSGEETAVMLRFSESPSIQFVSLGEEDARNPILAAILPLFVSILVVIAIFTSSGYIVQAIVDEKENRTMEIIITSITPERLMMGKIIGLIGVGLTQVFIWLILILIGLWVAKNNVTDFPALPVSWQALLITAVWFLPFYVLIASLTAVMGISTTSVAEAQQGMGIISMISVFPMYLSFLILITPQSPLAVSLTLFPFSSPMVILTRSLVAEVPWWQYLLSWLFLAGTAATAVYLASRTLRLGVLRYSQKLTWREMVAAFRA